MSGRLSARLRRVAEGLDSVLGEFVGSAQVGPYVPPDPRVRLLDPACPHCGAPISQHQTDRNRAIGRLYCPVPAPVGPESSAKPATVHPDDAARSPRSAESALKSVTQSAEGVSSVAHPIG